MYRLREKIEQKIAEWSNKQSIACLFDKPSEYKECADELRMILKTELHNVESRTAARLDLRKMAARLAAKIAIIDFAENEYRLQKAENRIYSALLQVNKINEERLQQVCEGFEKKTARVCEDLVNAHEMITALEQELAGESSEGFWGVFESNLEEVKKRGKGTAFLDDSGTQIECSFRPLEENQSGCTEPPK